MPKYTIIDNNDPFLKQARKVARGVWNENVVKKSDARLWMHTTNRFSSPEGYDFLHEVIFDAFLDVKYDENDWQNFRNKFNGLKDALNNVGITSETLEHCLKKEKPLNEALLNADENKKKPISEVLTNEDEEEDNNQNSTHTYKLSIIRGPSSTEITSKTIPSDQLKQNNNLKK